MTAPELLDVLHRAGVEVARAGGNLKLRGPREAMTPEVLARVRERKPELLTLLPCEVASTRARDNRPMVDAPAPLADHFSRPACGHDGALVLLTVEGLGLLCGDCWCLWVRGRLDWPALTVEHERGQA